LVLNALIMARCWVCLLLRSGGDLHQFLVPQGLPRWRAVAQRRHQEARSMRIALITAHSPLTPGTRNPTDRALQAPALARALASRGHRVTLYARCESQTFPRTAILGRGVTVEHVTAGPARPLEAEHAARHMPEFARYLADRWRAKRPDVVHAFSWTSGLAALGAVRGIDIPVVLTFESLGAAERRHGRGDKVSASRLRLEASIGRSAAAVLAGSSEEADELARLAVPKSAVHVVPCGVDTELFTPDGERAERGNRARLIAAAEDQHAAGLDAIIHAVAQLPEAELVIVGGPDGRHLPRSGRFRELAQLARVLGVRNRITFAGQVADKKLSALLRSADVLVSAAPYDPTGLTALRAMACGTPVVGSAVGARRDAVIDGTTGLLVESQDLGTLAHRLRKLLATQALLQAYGIAAVDRVRSRYSWDRVCAETAAAYGRCLPANSVVRAVADADEQLAAAERVDLASGLAVLG
jgi:glycosyltransferase involved in cell wall biosynthesis